MRVAEVFGFGVGNDSELATLGRRAKQCPFRGTPCTKSSKSDPLGICSLSDGGRAAALCPVRFLEDNRIFADAGRLAFGGGAVIRAFPEVRILTIPGLNGAKDRKIGKVDFLIGKIEGENVVDFAALEVQATYFSGGNLRQVLRHFMQNGHLNDVDASRRPDFRSSAQKRLVPQLALKIPVFRRWGKKFFVVVDSKFFGAMPQFPKTTQANAELTWLVYPLSSNSSGYHIGAPEVVFSQWDDVQNALREGHPPEPEEIMVELQTKHRHQLKRGDAAIQI